MLGLDLMEGERECYRIFVEKPSEMSICKTKREMEAIRRSAVRLKDE